MCLILWDYAGKEYSSASTFSVSDWIPPYQIRYAKAAPSLGHWLILDDHEEREARSANYRGARGGTFHIKLHRFPYFKI